MFWPCQIRVRRGNISLNHMPRSKSRSQRSSLRSRTEKLFETHEMRQPVTSRPCFPITPLHPFGGGTSWSITSVYLCDGTLCFRDNIPCAHAIALFRPLPPSSRATWAHRAVFRAAAFSLIAVASGRESARAELWEASGGE